MTDDRKSGLALIASSAASLVIMLLHPSRHGPASGFAAMMQQSITVHSAAIAIMPVMFLGALGLSRRLDSRDRLAISALVTYAFGLVAAAIAGALNGLVAPQLFRQMEAAPAPASEVWHIALHYNGVLNQAFAQIFVVAASAAIILWSAATFRNHALPAATAWYGCIIGPLLILGVVVGHIRMNVHGFGLAVLAQAIWFVASGVGLLRTTGSPDLRTE